MNLKIFAVAAAIALTLAAVTTTNMVQPAMAKNNDKCVSFQSKDRTETTRFCLASDKDSEKALHKDFKKQCKDDSDNKETRCSSSQTGFGEQDNFKP